MYSAMKENLPSEQCITADELVEYFGGRLPSPRQREVEEHLADCPVCVRRGREIQTFLSRLKGLSASNHGAAYLRDRAEEALAALTEGRPHWILRRLKSWSDVWRGTGEAAVRFAVGGAPTVEVVPSLVRPASCIGLVPAVAGVRVLGTPHDGTKSAVLEAPDRQARVELTWAYDCCTVTVAVGSLEPGSPVPLVALVPLQQGLSPTLLQMQPAGPRQFAARLEGIRTGDYLILVEPHPPGRPGVSS